MKVLVIGKGGREHAICWRLAKDGHRVFCWPGNPGIAKCARVIDLPGPLNDLADWAAAAKVDLTVVGPEQYLFDGIVPVFRGMGLAILGPTPEAARLESSKAWAKRFMWKRNIPTASGMICHDASEAKGLVAGHFNKTDQPLVIKADGPALGKGVTIAKSEEEARAAIDDLMVERIFGPAGDRILLEDFQEGWEASILALVYGHQYRMLDSAQDFKPAYPGGSMTGGMAAISPHPRLVNNESLCAQIITKIVEPTIDSMMADGYPYTGVLYCGLIITTDGPKVLEYNVRLGDPEAQALLPRTPGDFGELLFAAATGRLEEQGWQSWSDEFAMGFVLASQGYPSNDLLKDQEISGIEEVETAGGLVFHAGTDLKKGKLVNSGGRVLMSVRMESDFATVRSQALQDARTMRFKGAWFREDVGSEYL